MIPTKQGCSLPVGKETSIGTLLHGVIVAKRPHEAILRVTDQHAYGIELAICTDPSCPCEGVVDWYDTKPHMLSSVMSDQAVDRFCQRLAEELQKENQGDE